MVPVCLVGVAMTISTGRPEVGALILVPVAFTGLASLGTRLTRSGLVDGKTLSIGLGVQAGWSVLVGLAAWAGVRLAAGAGFTSLESSIVGFVTGGLVVLTLGALMPGASVVRRRGLLRRGSDGE